MLTATQRNLIDRAARHRGVDEQTFCAEADEQGCNPVDLAREVLAEAKEERGPIQPRLTRAPVTSSPAPRRKESNLSSLVEGWAEDYRCAATADDIDGLHALTKSTWEHIKDPALLMYATALSTIHRIKREKLEGRIAALEASKAEERMTYCGIFKADSIYEPGDCATHEGGLWYCWEKTSAKPGTTKSWQLMAKTRERK